MFKRSKLYTVFFHVCLWSVLFICIFLFRPHPSGGTTDMRDSPFSNLWITWSLLPVIVMFYLHAYWLIPAYFSRKKTAVYIISVLIALLCADLLSALSYFMGPTQPAGLHYPQVAVRRLGLGLFFLIASASLGAFRENFRMEKKRKEKETEHLRTELSFLRAQVNPHFMLNVLNSMALLARRKSDLLEPALMELAGLMNYMLYDANNEKILLADEIGYLQAYIDLQMLRFGTDVTVRFNTPEGIRNKCIEPMLLIPLVENAFKHGIGLVDEPVIFIDIKMEKEDRLSMTVKNKFNRSISRQENRPQGIGLKNLSKRLELIYQEEFELNVMDNYHIDSILTESWFIITLNIPLQ
jgi:two-component system, LytTR family, sensor kinase